LKNLLARYRIAITFSPCQNWSGRSFATAARISAALPPRPPKQIHPLQLHKIWSNLDVARFGWSTLRGVATEPRGNSMKERSKGLYWGLMSVAGLVVFGYFAHDYLSRTISPCETIFEQTSTQFDLKLNHLDIDGSLGLGRRQVQELTENAQVTALNLKTCCIVLNAGDVDPDQFLQCQDAGRQYGNKLDTIVAQVERLRSAQATGVADAIESLRGEIASTVDEAKAVAQNLRQEIIQLEAPPATPAAEIDDNVVGVAVPMIEEERRMNAAPSTSEVRVINYEVDPASAVRFSSSPLTSIVVQSLSRFDEPGVKEIFIVAAGASLQSGFYPVQRSSQFGKTMVVQPGRYDVVLDFGGQSMVHLVQGLELGEAQQATIAPDPLISFIVPSALELEGFPPISEVFLMDAGSKLGSVFYKRQASNVTGVPLVVPAGSYDVYVKPSGGRFIKLIDDVSVSQGEGVAVDINSNAAAIVYADPELDEFELKAISIVDAGTDISKSHYPVQEAASFGEPMMVPANGSYDIVLQPVDGQPVKVQRDVSPEAGRLTLVGPPPTGPG
jgi:hypothetical protein